MPTTIDSLQIEIQSNSTSAASGIRDLATSLESLKKIGSVNSVVKNLNNLSAATKGFNASDSATSSLAKLAQRLEALRNVGSIAKVGTNLSKLAASLKSVDDVNLDGTAQKIKDIAAAVSPLSNVKSGGINTMMLGLKKINDVTKSLDDKTLGDFKLKVDQLSASLTPLSQKMTTVAAGFKAINSKARSAGSGVKHMSVNVKSATLNFSTMYYTAQSIIGVLQRVVQMFVDVTEQAIEWDGIATRFGRGFGSQAQETYEWIQRLNKEMGINVQQFMQYSSVYATMLKGFGVANEDASKMALGYTELTYDIWAGYNDIYKSYADAADAVKSAIAGEVEPIRRAGFTIVESTLERTAANHGLNISLEKATESQKSYLRYLTLVDQAHKQNLVGTYAKELNTAEGLMRTFSQQLKSLAQAFGSLFLPVLVKVMPYLQAFVELLEEGVRWIAGFFGIEIRPVDWSSYNALGDIADSSDMATDSLGDTGDAIDDTTKKLKELKNATLGIDELNIISPPTQNAGSSGSGGSGAAGGGIGDGFAGLDVDSLWDESIFDNIQSKVDDIKQKLKDWLPVIETVGLALAGLALTHFLDDISKAISGMSTLGKVSAVITIAAVVGKIVWDLTGAYLEGGDPKDWLKILGTTVIGTALAYWIGGAVGAGLVLTTAGIVELTRLAVELKAGTVDWGDTQTWVTAITGGLSTLLGAGVLKKSGLFQNIGKMIVSALETGYLKSLYAIDWLKKLGTVLVSGFGGIAKWVPKLGTAIWTGLKGLGAAIAAHPFIAAAIAIVAAIVGAIVLAIVDYDFTQIGYKLGHALGSALKKVGSFFGTVGNWFVSVGKGIWNGITAAIDWCKKNINLESIKKFFVFIFNPENWKNVIIPKIKQVGKDIIDGLWNGLKNGWNNLKNNIKEFCSGFVKGFKDALGIHSPSKKFADIGKNCIDGLKGALSLNAIRDRIKSMWTTAKTWWSKSKGALSTYTPSIGSIKSKLSSAWSSAKTWWNKSKGKMSYTPSIGSIKSKVQSAWNTAKSWWNKNAKLSTKLNIKTPKISIDWGEVKAFGKSFRYPKGFDLKFAANGGMFNAGSLIWAGERGAEVVANAGGGKTGVMNIEQMQEAVYQGVYAALMATRGGSDGDGGNINVYLDGKLVSRSVEKAQRERGASIMGKEVFAY